MEQKNCVVVDMMGIPFRIKGTDANAADSQTAYELLSSVFFW